MPIFDVKRTHMHQYTCRDTQTDVWQLLTTVNVIRRPNKATKSSMLRRCFVLLSSLSLSLWAIYSRRLLLLRLLYIVHKVIIVIALLLVLLTYTSKPVARSPYIHAQSCTNDTKLKHISLSNYSTINALLPFNAIVHDSKCMEYLQSLITYIYIGSMTQCKQKMRLSCTHEKTHIEM